jgi:hypothetical protein
MRPLLVALLALVLAPPSSAAVVTYAYQGSPLDFHYGYGEAPNSWMASLIGSSYHAVLVIDEGRLGQSLKNASLKFEFAPPGYSEYDKGPTQGILGFAWGWPSHTQYAVSNPTEIQRPVAGGELLISTDHNGQIRSGEFCFLDGPPDGCFGSLFGDEFIDHDYSFIYGYPGTWSTLSVEGNFAAVPLPWTVGLLAAAFGTMLLFRRERVRNHL